MRIYLAAAALIVSVFVAGCTSEATYPEPTGSSTTASLVEKVTTTAQSTTTTVPSPQAYAWESDLTLAGVTLQISEPQSDTALTDTQKLFLDSGYGVVYVTVTITNGSTSPYPYSPMNFLLSDTQGQVFTMFALCSKPRLESGELQPGRVVMGAVPFEIPLESVAAYVDYFPTFDGVGTPDNLAGTWGYVD